MTFSRDGSRAAKHANGDQSANQYKFVDLANDDTISLHTGAGTKAYGVLCDDPTDGEVGTVQFRDVCGVMAGAAIQIGQEIEINGSGEAIPVATSGHQIVGIAEDSASGAGAIFACRIEYRGVH